MTPLDLVTGATLAVSAACLAFVVFRRRELQQKRGSQISVDELGVVEKDLRDLRRVIVVAHRIERPNNALAAAVENNLEEGVQYLFLISSSTASGELKRYFLIFEALARIVANRATVPARLEHLVAIHQLPYDWPDAPYIFYECWGASAESATVVAFRGNQKREGIADYYEPVPPNYAASLARSILSGAPTPLGTDSVTSASFTTHERVMSLVKR